MRTRWRRWRARQRPGILFVAVPVHHGTVILPSGLAASRRLRMIEARRGF